MQSTVDEAAILAIERPDKALWTYYWLSCLIIPPLFPILVLPAYFRYHTMRYKFTAEGISMSWGILFRREVILNYARIQDIHLRSNFIERWLGLSRVMVQTASGNASAEMTLEGLREFAAVRDFLYSRMRGVKEPVRPGGAAGIPPVIEAAGNTPRARENPADLAATLREVAAELRALRATIEARQNDTRPGGPHV